jgi:hypothetical protein
MSDPTLRTLASSPTSLGTQLWELANTLEQRAADLVDVDFDDRGRQHPSLAESNRALFELLTEEAVSLRSLRESWIRRWGRDR